MAPATQTVPGEIAGRDLNKYLTFTLGGDRFGIPVLHIKEIIEFVEMTPVPMMPAFIRGAINLRGHGVPVLDLALRFGGGKETAIGRRTCVVIVEARPTEGDSFDVGLLVDAVNEVADIGEEAIEAAPSLGGRIKAELIHGLGKTKSGFVILLDIDRILSLEDLARAEQAAAGV